MGCCFFHKVSRSTLCSGLELVVTNSTKSLNLTFVVLKKKNRTNHLSFEVEGWKRDKKHVCHQISNNYSNSYSFAEIFGQGKPEVCHNQSSYFPCWDKALQQQDEKYDREQKASRRLLSPWKTPIAAEQNRHKLVLSAWEAAVAIAEWLQPPRHSASTDQTPRDRMLARVKPSNNF